MKNTRTAASIDGGHGVVPGSEKGRDREVTFLARELKTPLIAQVFQSLAEQARTDSWSHEAYLAAVLGRQDASRAVNGTRMRISAARFPQLKTLTDFTFGHIPQAARDDMSHLATTTPVGRRENVVLLWPTGVGRHTSRSRWPSNWPGPPTRSCSIRRRT